MTQTTDNICSACDSDIDIHYTDPHGAGDVYHSCPVCHWHSEGGHTTLKQSMSREEIKDTMLTLNKARDLLHQLTYGKPDYNTEAQLFNQLLLVTNCLLNEPKEDN